MYNVRMAKKFSGKKFSSEHTTATDSAVDIIEAAKKLDEVTKIVLGPIRQCRGGKGTRTLKTKEIPAGLEIVVRGGSTVQTLWIYTTSQKEISRITKTVFYK